MKNDETFSGEDQLNRLIEEVRRQPCIYDVSHCRYKDANYKSAAWDELAAKCGFEDVEEAMKKWSYLRGNFGKELKKHGEYSNWSYFQSLLFLRDHCKGKPRLSATCPVASLNSFVNFMPENNQVYSPKRQTDAGDGRDAISETEQFGRWVGKALMNMHAKDRGLAKLKIHEVINSFPCIGD